MKTFPRFFEISLDLLCIAGEDGYFKNINPAWSTALGYTTEELLARPFIDFVHPDDKERTLQEATKLARGEVVRGFLNRYQTKTGEYRWLNWNAITKEGLIYCVVRDMTEEIRTKELQLDREHQIQSIAAHAPGMLYRFRFSPDDGYSCTFASLRAKAIFEIENTEVMRDPKLITNLILAEDRPSFDDALRSTSTRLTPFQWEGRIRTPSGRFKWVRAACEPRILPDNAILWDGLVWDITQEKEVDGLLKQQQAQMVNSSKLASLGEMAGGVAHEINNPLAILKGYALQIRTVLENEPKDLTRALEATGRIEATVDRIARIVTGLRKVSRDSTDDIPALHPVAELIADTLSLCTEKFRAHGIELSVSPVDPGWMLKCRPVELSQVLLNLLNNAHDAIEKAKEKWVKLEVEEDGPYLQIAVTDSGKGIPAPLRERILMPFFTTKPVGRGTGLGLSISKSIVEAHGGTLTLDVEHPRTRFVVCLPKPACGSSSRA